MIRATYYRHRLLERASLKAAAHKRRVELLVRLAARLLDHRVMDANGPVKLSVLDACLHEAGVDVDVRPETVSCAEVVNDGEGLVEPPCAAHKLHG